MFSSDRKKLRQYYIDAWQKYQQAQPLEALQKQIVSIIEQHPEYHSLLAQPEAEEQDFSDHNPFLHLSLHLALLEQISTDRPPGTRALYQQLSAKLGPHAAEHAMMDCLGAAIWQAQQQQQAPDEQVYLSCLKKLLGK